MYYVIRTLQQSGTKILIKNRFAKDADQYGFKTLEGAFHASTECPGFTKVHEFDSTAQARMYIDPACVGFRTAYDSKVSS